MTWTDPSTLEVTVGDLPRASWANGVLDNLSYLHGPPRVTLRRTTDFTVPTNTATGITWEESLVDVGGWWDSGSPGVAVVPEDGLYLVSTNILWDNNDEGDRQLRLLRDDVPVRGDRRTATLFTEQSPSWISSLQEGHALSLDVRQTSGEDRVIQQENNPARSPLLMIVRVAPAWVEPV